MSGGASQLGSQFEHLYCQIKTHHLLESIECSSPILGPLVQTTSIRVEVNRQRFQLNQLLCQPILSNEDD
jgi:hypothetical protein